MLYIKIKSFRGDRAVCVTDIGKDIDVLRTVLPDSASAGDVFRLGINEDFDGLTYTRAGKKEYRRYRQKLNERRKCRSAEKTDTIH